MRATAASSGFPYLCPRFEAVLVGTASSMRRAAAIAVPSEWSRLRRFAPTNLNTVNCKEFGTSGPNLRSNFAIRSPGFQRLV